MYNKAAFSPSSRRSSLDPCARSLHLFHHLLRHLGRTGDWEAPLWRHNHTRQQTATLNGVFTRCSIRKGYRADICHNVCRLRRSIAESESFQEEFQRHYGCGDANEVVDSSAGYNGHTFTCSTLRCGYHPRGARNLRCAVSNVLHHSI